MTAGNASARFFEDYKKNENKEVKVDEFLGAEVARKTVLDSMVSAFPLCECSLNPTITSCIATWDTNHHLLLAKHTNTQWPSLKVHYIWLPVKCMHACTCQSVLCAIAAIHLC